ETAADRLRARAVQLAQQLDRLDSHSAIAVDESQAQQLTAVLDLYHYVNPKLLVLTSAIVSALRNEDCARFSDVEPITSLSLENMHPLELMSDPSGRKLLR